MRSFVWSQFRFRRGRAAALALAVIVAAVSFTLLTAAATTSSLDIRGTVQSNYRAAYDVLVRPPGSAQPLEKSQRLVRPNFLSGVFGGISLEQYEAIKSIPRVEVAAPIANIGYVLPLVKFGVRINPLLTDNPVQLFRIRGTWISQNGTSRYPNATDAYVYYTRRHPLNSALEEEVPGREPFDVCQGIYGERPSTPGPFSPQSYMACYSQLSPEIAAIPQRNKVLPLGAVGNEFVGHFPILLAAIDPVQEARLLDLDRAVVSGRYLSAQDKPFVASAGGQRSRSIPAIVSTRNYVDERIELTIERLGVPPGVEVPALLGSARALRFLQELPNTVVERRSYTLPSLYTRLIDSGSVSSFSYWTTSGIRYGSPGMPLRPLVTTNPISVWESPYYSGSGGGLGYWPAPAANEDVQFRRLISHPQDNRCFEDVCGGGLKIVGKYDPAQLPGFSALSEVPLETYYPPSLQPADLATAKALGGKPLLPTQNLGDYIQQPPLVLTTLAAADYFLNSKLFKRAKGKASPPISAIRVRVAGVTGPDELSQARVRAVATAIHEQTGLEVDITAGSSPKPMLVQLPKGKFGRPEFLLREGWSKKGVSISFLQALDKKSLALFGLVLVICGFFLANGALASVRGRRREIGTLRTIGWSQVSIFTAILAELGLVGLAAGIVGTVLAIAIVSLVSLELPLARTLLVIPISVTLAIAAGAIPAWTAARGHPLDAVRPAVAGRMRRRHVGHFLPLALVNLLRTPVRTLVGAAGLAVGVAALTVLLAIERAFQGTLVDTLLGNAISIQVRGADLVAVILTIVLAGLSVADVLFLNLRDRAAEIATLRTVGWGETHLATVIALEGVGLGILGGIAGVVVGMLVGSMIGVPVSSLLPAALIAAAGGVAVAAVASLLPLSRLRVSTPPSVLAAE